MGFSYFVLYSFVIFSTRNNDNIIRTDTDKRNHPTRNSKYLFVVSSCVMWAFRFRTHTFLEIVIQIREHWMYLINVHYGRTIPLVDIPFRFIWHIVYECSHRNQCPIYCAVPSYICIFTLFVVYCEYVCWLKWTKFTSEWTPQRVVSERVLN